MYRDEMEMWTDGVMYRNAVYDCKRKEIRPLTLLEYHLVEYCFPFKNHHNDACTRIGYADFEREPFNSDDLLIVAKTIWEKEHRKRRVSNSLKFALENIPAYLKDKEKENE